MAQPSSTPLTQPPQRAKVLPGLHYSSIRHAYQLGPSPCAQKPDTDWGVQEGFHIPTHANTKTVSTEVLDDLFNSSTKPPLEVLKEELVTRCRTAHMEDVKRRRACPKRRIVEEEIRGSVEE